MLVLHKKDISDSSLLAAPVSKACSLARLLRRTEHQSQRAQRLN
jgi:hypothetical protein